MVKAPCQVLASALLALLLPGCGAETPPVAKNPAPQVGQQAPAGSGPEPGLPLPRQAVSPVDDPHSYSRPGEARVTHISLELDADFDQRILKGTATLTVERRTDNNLLLLDTRDLDIQDVRVQNAAKRWVQAYHELGETDPNLGTPLAIELPAVHPNPYQVRIRYRTSPLASGLQWLEPAQTAGKQFPFMFSQSQAIHARSWIPLQDSPAVRVTYDAIVRTPPELVAVMSARNEPTIERDGEYRFEMHQPVPAYLIAIGIGDLVFEAMGERTGVYAEPSLVDAAAAEFADTERMLEITEGMYGPYRWERYDLLILPPSFPFGGMENPRLSFITPTVIAGDQSLVSLIAHELAHSWSGNLVTNATWRDLWLNEGFTSYLESRIMEAVYGVERAQMEDTLAYQRLVAELDELPDAAQVLAIDLEGQDPDQVFSSVPYAKGQLFLVWLEQQYGRDRFDQFLRNYFDYFAFQSITTDQFLQYLYVNLLVTPTRDGTLLQKPAVAAWIFEPGLPADAVLPDSDAFGRVATRRKAWLDGIVPAEAIDTSAWTVHEWLAFLDGLPRQLSNGQLAELDAAFGLTRSDNSEIAHSWLLLAIANNYRPAFDRLESYLITIGRLKLVRPLYEELVRTPGGYEFAARVYRKARPGYHPLTQRTVGGIIEAAQGNSE